MADVVAHGLTLTLYSRPRRGRRRRGRRGAPGVRHRRARQGGHRHAPGGRRPRPTLLGVVAAVAAEPSLRFAALWTHFPVADGVGDRGPRLHRRPAGRRLAAGRADAGRARASRPPCSTPPTRPAPSPTPRRASTWCAAASPCTAVPPFPALDRRAGRSWQPPAAAGLRPVLSLRPQVTLVRDLDAGERPSYGRRTPSARAARRWPPCPSATPTASPGATSPGAVRCSSAAGAARWPGWSRWTRSWWTAGPTPTWPWATRWC